uniref:Uncharacterized protein n=1 Tax=Arundo donax TaxID=35708 RepID=A0A0A9HRQ4_ARUDO
MELPRGNNAKTMIQPTMGGQNYEVCLAS